MINENSNNKSKIIAILLYICLGPFCLGEIYLGYKDKFRNQMLRLLFILLGNILSNYFKSQGLEVINEILVLALGIVGIWIFVVYIGNIIKGFKIISGSIKTDANGLELK